MLTVEFHSKPSEQQFGYQAEFALGERRDSSNCITYHGTHGEVEQVAEEPMRSILAATLDCHRPSGSDAGMAKEY
jgi:hypothetical protein